MKIRVALVVLLGIVVLGLAGLRGCWDITKPVPWVSDAPSSGGASAAAR